MTFTFRPGVRANVPLLLGLAGGTGSGKTMTALLLARGIAGGDPFYVIDTENGRALHYADDFKFEHGELHAPFRPARYADAIAAAEAAGAKVIVVDSMSHEWTGDGGMLDWQEEEMRGEESRRMSSWIKPKADHRKFVTRLLQTNAHVILCFRAEPKVDMKKDAQGRWQVVPKASLVGLDGWVPISEKMLPYELTASFLLMADQPGIPKPIKLQEQHRPFFPLDSPITEAAGVQLAAWAAGGAALAAPPPAPTEKAGASDGAVADVYLLAARVNPEAAEATKKAIHEHREKNGGVNPAWLGKLRKALESRLPVEPEPVQDAFPIPASAR